MIKIRKLNGKINDPTMDRKRECRYSSNQYEILITIHHYFSKEKDGNHEG